MPEQVHTSPALFVSEQELLLAHERVNWVLENTEAANKVVARAATRLPKGAASMIDRLRKRKNGAGYRVILDHSRLFDYLVLEEIEREEMRQEQRGFHSSRVDLLKRFVTPPIKLAMRHNAFYAAVGMCLGICHYKAWEVLRLFQHVAPEMDRKGERECSRAKRMVTQSLLHRFGRVAESETIELRGKTRTSLLRERPDAEGVGVMRQALRYFAPSAPIHPIPPLRKESGPDVFERRERSRTPAHPPVFRSRLLRPAYQRHAHRLFRRPRSHLDSAP